MNSSAIATVVAAFVAGGAALVSALYAQRSASATRMVVADRLAARFREPLLQAAFNLQTRIYNIVNKDFMGRFAMQDSSPEEREYAVENTMYLLGQYFCWVEIVRRESQFLDPRSHEVERQVANQLERVRDAFATSELPNPELRIFRGQQRALGEVLLDPIESAEAGMPRWECMGYARFIDRVTDKGVNRWFQPLRVALATITADPEASRARLVLVQHELLRLVEVLDPGAERTSDQLRERL